MNQITTATPSGFAALTPEEKRDHRVKIGLRAEAILGQFWRDDETPDLVRTLEIEGWIDVLENCSHSEIRTAWATYQKTGPRTERGRLYKPDAGALYRIILDSRPKPQLVSREVQPEPERQRITKERAKEIMAEVEARAGLSPDHPLVKRFGGQPE
jgi:hypothetical protein